MKQFTLLLSSMMITAAAGLLLSYYAAPSMKMSVGLLSVVIAIFSFPGSLYGLYCLIHERTSKTKKASVALLHFSACIASGYLLAMLVALVKIGPINPG